MGGLSRAVHREGSIMESSEWLAYEHIGVDAGLIALWQEKHKTSRRRHRGSMNQARLLTRRVRLGQGPGSPLRRSHRPPGVYTGWLRKRV